MMRTLGVTGHDRPGSQTPTDRWPDTTGRVTRPGPAGGPCRSAWPLSVRRCHP